MTLEPFARCSRPIAAPYSFMSSLSNEAATVRVDGHTVA
eukprot:CAMPEP_0175876430 /NCGR_PEP_ID=MMETSP0107_2-20121207/40044_1 /TAXON_ID=195067 ORGANISM="Goniomonas pacifica, Strain CCMP1869" /NCGR_SAMPLE_ID=MMETSP0107_2 /ASSEMBLY_ACC=CAM_ASM_000203 /LENGTH=38 /DNA_ID= /DNA_START= /DNA_END= /DNA_ORIENTATION=